MPHGPPSEVALRVERSRALLIEKGLVDPAALDELIETYEHKVGPHHGARVVARAWSDPSFKEWLLRDPNAAIASLGYRGRQGEHMRVVENTGKVHNLVVCALLLLPLAGTRAAAGLVQVAAVPLARGRRPARRARRIRHRAARRRRDPGVDSTSEVRFLVLPERPPGTEGWSEAELAKLVTRNAMIGVERAKAPGDAGRAR